jgi:hypothetical protein
MSGEWQPIETAPKDGTVFMALNEDGEIHVCKIDKIGRKLRRSHQQRWSQSFAHYDDMKVLTKEEFHFDTYWSIWTKGYEFSPTHWIPLPNPPQAEEQDSAA